MFFVLPISLSIRGDFVGQAAVRVPRSQRWAWSFYPWVLLAESVGYCLSIESEGKSSLGFHPDSMAEWAANVD